MWLFHYSFVLKTRSRKSLFHELGAAALLLPGSSQQSENSSHDQWKRMQRSRVLSRNVRSLRIVGKSVPKKFENVNVLKNSKFYWSRTWGARITFSHNILLLESSSFDHRQMSKKFVFSEIHKLIIIQTSLMVVVGHFSTWTNRLSFKQLSRFF